jgi:hypothetical protein
MNTFARMTLSVFLAGAVLFSGLTALSPPARAQAVERGNLVGQVFDRDGRTPVAGAVVRLRNITSGAIYESPAADGQGRFRIDLLAKGIYTYGISAAAGDFNSNELIGILANETTKVSISLNPYESGVQTAVQEILREQADDPAGESRIGRVLRYDPATRQAEVFVERGLIQLRDQLRFRGARTNFAQDATSLVLGRDRVRRVMAGQSAWIDTVKPVETGDLVYVICHKGIAPFFLSPCGIAWVIAGSGAILAGIIEITEKESVSPSKPSAGTIK